MKIFTITIFCFLFFISVIAQQPSFDWVKQMGGSTGNIFILSSVTDASGNLYLTGVFDGSVEFNPAVSNDSVTDSGFGDIFISKIDSSGNVKWFRQIGRESYDQGTSIALDNSGNIYVTGFFSRDSTDFDPGVGTYYLSNLVGGELTYVLKLDPAGNFQWAKELESGSSTPSSITLDASDNILITGIFEGTVDFDPGAGVLDLTASASDIYILKLNSSGDYIWSKQINANASTARSFSIATDALENIYMTGLLIGTVDFDPGTGITNLTSTGGFGAEYILKLDSSGNFDWAKEIFGDISQTGGDHAIKVDHAGNSYTGGWFGNTVDFDPNAGVSNLSNTVSTGSSTYILKLDSSGNFIRANQIGDPGDGNFRALTLDASDNLYVSGLINLTGDFDPGNGIDTLSISNGSTFVAKYDSAGNLNWAVNFSNSNGSSDHSHTLNVDLSGNIITTGVFHDSCDFDPASGVLNLTSISAEDVFIHKMNHGSIASVNDFILEENNLSVFPNPSDGLFHIKTNKDGVYIIADETGQVIRTFSVNTGNKEIVTITGLSSGVYFLYEKNKIITRGKIIVVQK